MKLNFKKIGEGAPLIIVHGLFGSLDNWMTMARQLSQKFTVYLIDQRNHGKSPHSEDMNYELMASDLFEFMKEHNIERSNFIGHSMGGKAIIQLALNHPECIRKMMVIDIGIKKYPMHHQKILAGLNGLDIKTLESRKQAEERIALYIEEKAVQFFLLKGLFRNKDGSYGLKFNLNSLESNMENILTSVTGEISETDSLFVRGELSGYILEEDYANINEQFPYSKIVTIEGAGHWIHAEKPNELKEIILNYF